jgi:SAM-dependent methyltransferase
MTDATHDSVFRDYAPFYDALYDDKDYSAECRFLESLLSAHGVEAGASLLDLGCGTGSHDIPLALAGFDVTGVDLSPDMIAIAQGKAAEAGVSPNLLVGDVREIALGRTFEAVISMFAVVGYQLSNEDLSSMFSVARNHLRPGGVFTFDAWFGPAVLVEQPEVKSKTVRLPDGNTIRRIAEPTLDVVAQTVRVDYRLVRETASGPVEEVRESHTMRFLFAQEVAYFLQVAGFEVAALMPFMREGETPTASDWNVTWVARAV